MQEPYYSFSSYLTKRYGEQLHRIPIDLGFGCPNRDPDGSGGCAFCAEGGARSQQTLNSETIEDQVRDAVQFARRRYRARRYMAYIQGYTGTFAPASVQRREYERVLRMFDFDAVSIGTRPDCLDSETLEFLEELNQRCDLWVELGVQTTHDETLVRVNRGHDWACSQRAIRALTARGIAVAAHVILGLPGERVDEFNATAERLAELNISGLKLHNLHIVKGTQLADEFARNPFPLLNEYEYLDAVIEFLRRTPADIPIMRLQTDTPEQELVAPRWRLAKGQFLELVSKHMRWRVYCQGDLCRTPHDLVESIPPVTTEDGSVTFWSEDFKEHYHSPAGAHAEAQHKYVEAGNLQELLSQKPVRILDVCFGLGYNTLAACEAAKSIEGAHLDVVALEIDRRVVCQSTPHQEEFGRTVLEALFESANFHDDTVSIKILWGDARHQVTKAGDEFDLVFLDAFSTQRNSELWTVEFFERLKRLMCAHGRILTYCAALPVRAGLLEAGFHVGNTAPFGRERPGTIAALAPDEIEWPIGERELHAIMSSTKGIPYRDASNISTNRDILRRREEAVKRFKYAKGSEVDKSC